MKRRIAFGIYLFLSWLDRFLSRFRKPKPVDTSRAAKRRYGRYARTQYEKAYPPKRGYKRYRLGKFS